MKKSAMGYRLPPIGNREGGRRVIAVPALLQQGSAMPLPESTPGQTKWFCLILGIGFGAVSLLALGQAGHAMLTGEAAYDSRRNGRIEVSRKDHPAAFRSAVVGMVTPNVLFVPLSLIGFYFYRKLRD